MRFLSREEVKRRTLYSHVHRGRLEEKGLFPKRIRLGNGPRCRVGYPEELIDQWMLGKGYPLPEETDDKSSE